MSEPRRAPHPPPAVPRAGVVTVLIGGIGELLLTAGLVVALFLAWQLWWTDVIADRDQGRIVEQLEARWGTASAPSDASRIAPEQHGEPPAVATVGNAQVFATLHVPAFDRSVVPVAEGVGREDVLNVIGAGHYPGTAMPGAVGNFAVAAHRTTYGKPFHDIDRLQTGDPVVVQTQDAYYVYEVTGHEIVKPTDVQVVAPVPDDPDASPTERMMTMTACHPLYSARERYVVHARLAYWTRAADGIPPALAHQGAG